MQPLNRVISPQIPPKIDHIELHTGSYEPNVLFQISPKQPALAIVSLPMKDPGKHQTLPLGVGDMLQVRVVSGQSDCKPNQNTSLIRIRPRDRYTSFSLDGIYLRTSEGRLLCLKPSFAEGVERRFTAEETKRATVYHVGTLKSEWSDFKAVNEEPTEPASILIKLLSPDSEKFLEHFKQQVTKYHHKLEKRLTVNDSRFISDDRKSKLAAARERDLFANTLGEIQRYLAVVDLGGLRHDLLNSSQFTPYGQSVSAQLPTSFDALRADQKYREAMKAIEATDDFVVFSGSTRMHGGDQYCMLDHLAGTHLYKTDDGKFRLSQQMGFILTVYNRCPEHYRKTIEDILIDVMRRCVDRAQRQMSTAVFKTAIIAASINMINQRELADVFVGLFKEFLIDQVAISNDNLWEGSAQAEFSQSLSENGFSDESAEDALALRKALCDVLKLGPEGTVKHGSYVAIDPSQHAGLLCEVCYFFCSLESLELFSLEQQEAMEVLLRSLLPIYGERVNTVHTELNELTEYMDDSNFESRLASYLEENGFADFEFQADKKFDYYCHVERQLKLADRLSMIVVAKILWDAEYLTDKALDKIPGLRQLSAQRTLEGFKSSLEALALDWIPWLAQPTVMMEDDCEIRPSGSKRQVDSMSVEGEGKKLARVESMEESIKSLSESDI